jgi:hypothetical protein
MAQKVDLKAPFVVPANARKLLFNTQADFTVVLPGPLENCIKKNK